MTWKERWIGLPLAFVGGVLAIAVVAVLALTRTPWGQERVGELLAERLLPRLQGTVRFATIGGNDLLAGARLTGVEILDSHGELFLRADTVELEYDWHDFLRGDIIFRSIELVRPEIVLAQDRGGRWNFAHTFGTRKDTARVAPKRAADREGAGQRIELRQVAVREGNFTARTPVDEVGGFWRTEEGPDGAWRVSHVLDFDAELPLLRIDSREPSDPLVIRIGQLAGEVLVVRERTTVRDLRANVQILGDTVSFDLHELELPASRLSGRGVVRIVEPETQLDLTLRGERVALADMRWLVSWLPGQGRSTFDLRLVTLPEGLSFDFQDADLRIGASRVEGRLGFMLAEEEVRFRGVDVRLDPLETRWIDTLTADTLFFQGLLRGDFRGDGPVSRMSLETTLTLESAERDPPSHVAASGVLTWDGSFGGDSLVVSLDEMEMAIVESLLSPGLPIEGRLTGPLTFRGTLAQGLEVQGDLTHSDGGRPGSRLVGGGRITGTTDPRIDLQFEANPLSLTTLAAYYPTLPFRGDVRGPIGLRGTLNDLDVDARLRTSRGRLVVRGRFDLSGEPKRYAADLEGEEVQVAALRPGLPASDLDFRAHIEGSGLRPEELELRGWVRVLPSEFAGARVDSGYVRLLAEDGVLTVDSARIASDAGRLQAHGRFGLREDTEGTLSFAFVTDTLAAWNRWIPWKEELEGSPPAVATLANGSGGLPVFQEEPALPGAVGPLRGAARGSGTLAGNLERIRLEGLVGFIDPAWNEASADSAAVRLSAEGPPRDLALSGIADAWSVSAAGFELSSGRLTFDLAADTARLTLEARKGDEARVRGGTSIVRLPQGVRITVDSLTTSIRGEALTLEQPTTIVRDGRTLHIEPFRLTGGLGTITAEAEVPETGAASLQLRIFDVDLRDVAAVFPDSLDVQGPLRVELRLRGSPAAPQAEFEAQVEAGRLLGVEFSQLLTRGRFGDGNLHVDVSARRERDQLFEAAADVPMEIDLNALTMRRTSEPMELRLRAEEFPLAFALASFDQFRDVGGLLQGELALHGTFDEPDLSGEIQLREGALRMPEVGIRFSGAEGRVRFRADVAELEEVVARAPEGGRGRVQGTVRLSPLSNPEFNLSFDLERLLAYNTRVAHAVVSGRVNLTGVYRRPVITGELTVESSTLFIREIERRQEIIDLSDPTFFTVVDTTIAENRRLVPLLSDPFFQNMSVDLTLHFARDSWLRGRDRAIEIAGDLQLRWDRAQQDLRMSGTLEALRGEYTYMGKRFSVVGGTIEFVGSPGLNPDLNLIARHVVHTPERPLTIRILVTGSLENPKIRLESDAQPPLDESVLLSYLIFGRPFSELTRGAGNGRPGLESTVREGVLGFATSELEALLVAETGLVDYLEISGTPAIELGYAGESATRLGTRVEAGWYLAPDVFVTVGQRFGGGARSDIPDVRLDWRITRNLSLQFVSEERLRRFQPTPTTSNPERAFGLFFFHEWSY